MIDNNKHEDGSEHQEDTASQTTTSKTPATPAEPVYINDEAHLETLVVEYDVVLVEFYAEWSEPCKAFESVVEELAAKTPATVTKIDIDRYQKLAAEYQIENVPTLYLFVDDELVERLVGGIVFQGEETLAGLIEQYLQA